MGRNRVVGIPLQTESVAASFTAGHSVDSYYVNTVESDGEVTVTLDPFAAHGDQVLIQDSGDNAAVHNIDIVPSGSQTIGVALASSLVINTDGGGFLLTYQNADGEANWSVLAQSSITPGGSGVTSVSGNAPITSTGGANPHIGITAATDSNAGSMSAADKTKLDGLAAVGSPATTFPATTRVVGPSINTDLPITDGESAVVLTLPQITAPLGAVVRVNGKLQVANAAGLINRVLVGLELSGAAGTLVGDMGTSSSFSGWPAGKDLAVAGTGGGADFVYFDVEYTVVGSPNPTFTINAICSTAPGDVIVFGECSCATATRVA